MSAARRIAARRAELGVAPGESLLEAIDGRPLDLPTSPVDEALEVLGGLVSRAGGEGDWALDVVKDALALRGVAA